MDRISIAIDGPAGSGKSTAAKAISRSLGFIYLDTGAMYRAVAFKALCENADTKDRNSLSAIMESLDIKIEYLDGGQLVFLNGKDVTSSIRAPEVSIAASDVSAVPEVRLKLTDIQREIAKTNNVVMDGRDIGTYVLPGARYKFYLTASIEERANRRYKEQLGTGYKQLSMDAVKDEMEYRDRNDSSRKLAPLRKAEDAIEIDTTGMTAEQVAEEILSYINTPKNQDCG